MGPKKGRRVRKIEVPTDSVPEFEWWGTATDMKEGGEGGKREGGGTTTATEGGGGKEGGGRSGGITQEEGQPEKRPRTERSDTETEADGREAGTLQSRYKKGDMTNVFFTDSDE